MGVAKKDKGIVPGWELLAVTVLESVGLVWLRLSRRPWRLPKCKDSNKCLIVSYLQSTVREGFEPSIPF